MGFHKKMIAALCCAAVSVSMLAGCSKKSKETGALQTNTQKPANEEKQEEKGNSEKKDSTDKKDNVVKMDNNDKKEEPAAEISLGGYTEEEIDAPSFQEGEFCTSFYINSKGKPTFVSTQLTNTKKAATEAGKKQTEEDQSVNPQYVYFTYTWKDGTWGKDILLGLDQLPDGQYISDFTEYADGKYYLMSNKFTAAEGDDESKTEYFLYEYNSKTHKLDDISPDQWMDLSLASEDEAGFCRPENLTVSSEEELFYLTSATKEVHLYNPKTKKHDTVDCGQGVNRFAVTGRKLYYANWESVTAVDLDTQKEEPIPTSNQKNVSLMTTKTGKLYTAGEAGINGWNPETENWECIIEGKDSLLGVAENNYISKSFAMDGEHDEFYLYIQKDKPKVIHTYYDPTLSNVKKEQLTIYSLFETEQFRDTVAKYQQTHKDIKVDYIVGLQKGEEGLVDDEIKRVNAELLAGNGADLYILCGLPTQEFIEKAVLADLSEILKPLAEQDELLGPMMDYYTDSSGAIYQYPVRMAVPISIYSEPVTQENPTIDDLIQLADSNDKVETVIGNEFSGFVLHKLAEYGSFWMKEDKTIDVEQWKSFVRDMSRIKGSCYKFPFQETEETTEDETEEVTEYHNDGLFRSMYYGIYGDHKAAIQGETLRTDMSIGSTVEMVELQAMVDQYKCRYRFVNNCFVPYSTLGMNQNGMNKERAKDFLQTIYTMDYQYGKSFYTLPVTKSALEKTIIIKQEDKKNYNYGFGFKGERECDIYGEDIRDEFMMDLYEKLCKVERPIIEDTKLLSLLAEQTFKGLGGEKQLDEAAAELSNQLMLYLAE